MWPPDPALFKVHHTTSHDPDTPDTLEFLTRVELWYAERVSSFLQELAATRTPAAARARQHAGALRQRGGRALPQLGQHAVPVVRRSEHRRSGNQVGPTAAGLRSTNDLWMACAAVYGLTDFTLGDSDQHTTAIEGASFSSAPND